MLKLQYYIIVLLLTLFSSNIWARSVAVTMHKVQRVDFSDSIEALGTTKAIETAVISANTTEKIVAIHFQDGQHVKKNQILLELDAQEEKAQLTAALGDLGEAEAAYVRAKNLVKSRAISEASLLNRKAVLGRAQGNVDAIKARIANLTISAPFDGVLGLREVSVGALVRPGDPITTIDDLSKIRVDFDIPSVYLGSIKPGDNIEGQVHAYGKTQFSGQIQTINTQVDPVTRTVKVRAILPNANHVLKPGMLMVVTVARNLRQALVIPEEALIKRGKDNYVFTVVTEKDTMKAKRVSINIGERKPGLVEVLSGLRAQDTIIVHGINKVKDGTTVLNYKKNE